MKNLLPVAAVLSVLTSSASAQVYQASILPSGRMANAISSGGTAGTTGSFAAKWDANGVATVMHPSFLSTTPGKGFSTVLGLSGSLSVGYGAFESAPNRARAIRWVGANASLFADPFPVYSSVALATDGTLAGGWAAPPVNKFDIPGPGDTHAILWNALSGAVVADLSKGKKTAILGMAPGQQVGTEDKFTFQEARLWRGTANSVVNLHPKGTDWSTAAATDGVHQAGSVAIFIKTGPEIPKGRRLFVSSAGVWSGTAASFQYLPFVPSGSTYSSSYATGISGDLVCGHVQGLQGIGTIGSQHAVAWSLSRQTSVDLHNLLPGGYVASQATSIDAQGNVAGYAVDSLGVARAVVWRRIG